MNTQELLEEQGCHCNFRDIYGEQELKVYLHGDYLFTLTRGRRNRPWRHMHKNVTSRMVLDMVRQPFKIR